MLFLYSQNNSCFGFSDLCSETSVKSCKRYLFFFNRTTIAVDNE